MTIYRKRGVVVRWENGVLVRVLENGLAIERDDCFECRPEPREGDAVDFELAIDSVARAAGAIRAAIPPGVSIERLLLLEGSSEHEYEGARWSDRHQRLHLAITRNRLRVLLDLGAFDVDAVRLAAEALARAEEEEKDAPARLRLAPPVTAAFLPALVGLAPPNVRLLQSAGGIDGKGLSIVEARAAWPNWYRPSYRTRPRLRPLNLRIECDVTVMDDDRPRAVALLGPVEGLTARVLVEDSGVVRPATVRLSRIDAVGPVREWYPYGAGSFGAEMML